MHHTWFIQKRLWFSGVFLKELDFQAVGDTACCDSRSAVFELGSDQDKVIWDFALGYVYARRPAVCTMGTPHALVLANKTGH